MEQSLGIAGCRDGGGPATPCAPPWPTSRPGDLVLVACSGGADSLALAAALAFEATVGRVARRRGGRRPRPAARLGARSPRRPRSRLRDLGLDPVEVVTVEVDRRG